MSKIYVTFHIKYIQKDFTFAPKRYAVECDNMDEALECISDINAVDGAQYLRMRHSKPNKNVTIFSFKNYDNPYKF